MDLNYQYTKYRSTFGRQCLFSERVELLDNISVNTQIQKTFILRNPVTEAMQHGPHFSEKTVNTIRPDFTSTGMNHTEGGWGKDINLGDPEQIQRYRRKIEKDEGYQHCVNSLCPGMTHYVRQNNAINLYELYYKKMEPHPEIEKHFCRTVNIYKDYAGKRPVTSISWQNDGGRRFATAYVDVNFHYIPRGSVDAYVWNVEFPIRPETILTPPCTMCDLQFNPRDGQSLCGGLINGQVCAFDLRMNTVPVAICSIHYAHRDVVKNVLFVNSKSGQEFFSGSTDGSCKWWDIRKLEEPIEEIIIDVVQNAADSPQYNNSNGVSVLEYEPTIPSRFIVGTENGYVISGNRKGKTQTEKIPSRNKAHNGPVYAVERNPFFLKNFLTAGDWTVRIWSEDVKESSIMFTRPFRHKVTHAAWSPTRTSLFTICQQNGHFSCWDMLKKQHEETFVMQVCAESLSVSKPHEAQNGHFSCWDMLKKQHEETFVMQVCAESLSVSKPHEAGGIIACGSEKGNTYLIDLSPSFQTSDKNERNLFAYELEKEAKRERILEARLREHRLKLRQQAEEGSPRTSELEVVPIGDKDLTDATNDFFNVIKKELSYF